MSQLSESIRWPAEWEPHRATWIAWPHEENDFPGKFEAVKWVYPEIVRILAGSELVEILCVPGSEDEISEMPTQNGVAVSQYRLHPLPTDRSWLRDSLPSFVTRSGRKVAISWKFNAWAKYDNYLKDAELYKLVAKVSGAECVEAIVPNGKDRLVLEGGAIDGDGQGTLLVTEECLLSSTQVRNPGLTKSDYETAFASYLGTKRTIWLDKGCVGDDTHGHIDDIARFTAPGEVILAVENDKRDANFASSQENLKRLLAATSALGQRLKVRTIPMPHPVYFDGQRLPASYANFYVANTVVIVPTFNDERDSEALLVIKDAFPTRRIVGINCRDLVWGLGTLHCLTQQEPA